MYNSVKAKPQYDSFCKFKISSSTYAIRSDHSPKLGCVLEIRKIPFVFISSGNLFKVVSILSLISGIIIVYSLENFDHSLLRCTTLLKPDLNMIVFVSAKLATYSGVLLATSVFDLIVPLIGSVMILIPASINGTGIAAITPAAAVTLTNLFLSILYFLSVISSVTTAAMTYNFLDNMLQNMKHDAVLIYEHISTTDVDQRT
jgi:hypothetical protein